MKKLLLLPLLLLFLFPASSLAFTPEYQDLETLVAQLTADTSPVTDVERARLEGTLNLAKERAAWSIDSYAREESLNIEHRFQTKSEKLERRARSQFRKARKRINTWYQKNKESSDALLERDRRLARAEKVINERYESAIKLLEVETAAAFQYATQDAQLYLEKIEALAERGLNAIDKRPSKDVVVS